MSANAESQDRGALRQAAGAGIARAIGLPFNALAAVFTARITVAATGVDVYGYINLIAQLFTLLPFADLGLGAAITRTAARAGVSEQDRKIAWSTLVRSLRVMCLVALVGLSISILLAFGNRWSRILGIPLAAGQGASLVASLSVSLYFIAMPLAVGQRLLVGLGKSVAYSLLSPVPSLVTLSTVVIMSACGVEGFMYALATSIGGVVMNVGCFLLARRFGEIPLTRLVKGMLGKGDNDDWLVPITLWMSASAMLVASISAAFLMNGGRIMAAHLLSGADVSAYAIGAQLFQPLWSVVYMASTSLWPRFAVGVSPSLWWWSNAVFAGVGIVGAAGFVIFGGPVGRFMTSGSLQLGTGLVASFGLLLFVMSLNATQAMVLTDSRGLAWQAACGVLACVFVIFGSARFVDWLGVAGVPATVSAACLVFQVVPLAILSRLRARASR